MDENDVIATAKDEEVKDDEVAGGFQTASTFEGLDSPCPFVADQDDYNDDNDYHSNGGIDDNDSYNSSHCYDDDVNSSNRSDDIIGGDNSSNDNNNSTDVDDEWFDLPPEQDHPVYEPQQLQQQQDSNDDDKDDYNSDAAIPVTKAIRQELRDHIVVNDNTVSSPPLTTRIKGLKLSVDTSMQQSPLSYHSHHRRCSSASALKGEGHKRHSRSHRRTMRKKASSTQSNNSNTGNGSSTANVFKSVQKVGQHAARTTKHAVWDTNELSITAALSVVNQWETLYHTIRKLVLMALQNSTTFYHHTIKRSLRDNAVNNTFVQFIRDWIALPTLHGMEKLIVGSILFVQSNEARMIADETLHIIRRIPWIGGTIIAPCVVTTGSVVQTMWNIIQYPIPSKTTVRNSVDTAMTFTKWSLATIYNEIALYIQRADANITRTLSHTRWKVLGSGPYETLPEDSKKAVIDHMCERYYYNNNSNSNTSSSSDNWSSSMISRYELAAHVKRHNFPLYVDLVWTGIWKERGGALTADDEWLNRQPIYRASSNTPFLLDSNHIKDIVSAPPSGMIFSALWFRLPNVNGERPAAGDAPWTSFSTSDQLALERRYLQLVQQYNDDTKSSNEIIRSKSASKICVPNQESNVMGCIPNTIDDDDCDKCNDDSDGDSDDDDDIGNNNDNYNDNSNTPSKKHFSKPLHPTIAQWYDTDPSTDVLVDQKRHSVSFTLWSGSCSNDSRRRRRSTRQINKGDDIYKDEKKFDDVEHPTRRRHVADDDGWAFGLPPLSMVYRPNFWRFYGPGDEVCRAVWFIDIPGKGLQPFDDEAHSVLEDAFLFLQWIQQRQTTVVLQQESNDESDNASGDNSSSALEGALLTVEVSCPDGAERLVQFSSLTRATAIQKGLRASMALFKLRVYRGAWLDMNVDDRDEIGMRNNNKKSLTVEDAIVQAVQEHGVLGNTIVPNVSLRSLLIQSEPVEKDESILRLEDCPDYTLAAPLDRLRQDDMARFIYDDNVDPSISGSDKVDHLVLIVHGIGEMLRSADVFGIASLSSIVDCCRFMRKNHDEIQSASSCAETNRGRVEYLPVEWHEAFAILSQRREAPPPVANKPNVMIKDISLKTIPNMRNFANDTLMDVLYFMSPEHHDMMVEVVVEEMNFLVHKFSGITNFTGSISIIGHSLGSIITWDILGNQPDDIMLDDDALLYSNHHASRPSEVRGFDAALKLQSKTESMLASPSSVSNISQDHSALVPLLEFPVSNFFMLGSPVAVFLMIRNQRIPLTDDFYLPGCRKVFNIFHPYDPVAYRIEPCIDPRYAEAEPSIIMHWNGGYRMHYQTRRMWKKLVETTRKTQRDFVGVFEENMTRIGLLGGASIDIESNEDSASEVSSENDGATARQGAGRTGQLNRGMRIDYMLQESEIENANEYVAALAAHSSYWPEKDLSLFIETQINS